MPELYATVSPDFAQAAKRLRGADKQIRKDLNKAIRGVTKPIQADLKRAVMGVDSKASGGGGTRQRAAHSTAKRAPRGGHGLRATIARAIQTKITYAGPRTGVRIRVDTAKLPPGQRKLPRHMDTGTWQHPVMGDPDVWVAQTVTPAGWFTATIKPHSARARAQINEAAQRALKAIEGG